MVINQMKTCTVRASAESPAIPLSPATELALFGALDTSRRCPVSIMFDTLDARRAPVRGDANAATGRVVGAIYAILGLRFMSKMAYLPLI